ncbi:NACHT domain-containing protein [Nocardia sp. NPDC005978]|uniref:NACHT domain-containing protein n=1 Tax=Nocardia sp. NPDC005978 TaxID=3156725 RepID=UPI0033B787CE
MTSRHVISIGATMDQQRTRLLDLTAQNPEFRVWLARASSVAAASAAVATLAVTADAGLSAPLSLALGVVPAAVALAKLDRFSRQPDSHRVADANKSVKRLRNHYGALAKSYCVDAPDIAPQVTIASHSTVVDGRIDPAGSIEHSETVGDECLVPLLYRDDVRRTVLLGNPGSGKSVLSLKLAAFIANDYLQKQAHKVPLVLPLRDWSAGLALPEWIIEQASYLYAIPTTVTRRWLDDGILILFLDGYDEVRTDRRGLLLGEIARWNAGVDTRMVITCRASDPELSTLLSAIGVDRIATLQAVPAEQSMDYLESAMGQITIAKDAPPYRPDVARVVRILRDLMVDDSIREQVMLGLAAASRAENVATVPGCLRERDERDPAAAALALGNQLYAAGNYGGAKIAYLEAGRAKHSSKHSVAILLYGICEAFLGNKDAARKAVYDYVEASLRDPITPSEAGNRVNLGTSDERQVLAAMRSGISYDLCQVCSRSKLVPSRVTAALQSLREIGAIDTPFERLDGIRYRRSDAFAMSGD